MEAINRPKKSVALGCYLYAVIDLEKNLDGHQTGIDEGEVYTIQEGKLAAVVSNLMVEKIRPERRRLAAHHEVLKNLMAEHTVLPMAFGLVAESPNAIRKILSNNREALTEQLGRVANKVEMGLRVAWDVPDIFEYFVNTHAELQLLRNQVFRTGREPSQADKIELGRLFDRSLTNERQMHSEKVMDILRPYCFEIKENKPRDEREVMNLACLVGKANQQEFEQGIFEAANLFDNHFSFNFNGPWPPHNFVDVALKV